METTNTFIENYLETLSEVSPKTKETYAKALSQYLKWTEATGRAEITKDNLLQYRQDLINGGKSAYTVNSYLTAIKGLYAYASEVGDAQPIGKIRNVKTSRGHKKDALSISSAQQLLSIERHDPGAVRDQAIIRLALTLGLRTIEIVRLNVEDYTVKSGQSVLLITHKGAETHGEDYLILTPENQAILNKYLSVRGGSLKDGEPLFKSISNHTANGGRLTTGSVSRLIKTALRSIGIDNSRTTAHSLRHSCFSYALASGSCSVRDIQLMAGHSSSMTTELYLHDQLKLSGKAEYSVEAVLSTPQADNQLKEEATSSIMIQ